MYEYNITGTDKHLRVHTNIVTSRVCVNINFVSSNLNFGDNPA